MKLKFTELLKKRLDASQGRIPCDWVLTEAEYFDVFSCTWKTGSISIYDGTIVGVDQALPSRQKKSLRGKRLVPGFVDAHVHVESSMMLPANFDQAVLRRGTTTAICDPHELANVLGKSGIEYFLESSSQAQMDLWIMMSSCVPATHMETNGGGEILAEDLRELAKHPRALGLAEMMNVPGVLHGDPNVLQKLEAFSGRVVDGHCPLLGGQDLSTYAVAGISSCHESSNLEEAREKLSKGISVWIREGSVAKDLQALAPLMTPATSAALGFCTDDRNPLDIAQEGHVDHLVRRSIQLGISPEVAYRTASWSVARHYGLDRGLSRIGAIAPGFQADVVVLEDSQTVALGPVMKKGQWIEEADFTAVAVPRFENSIRAQIPTDTDLEGPTGRVRVIGVLEGKIITEHRIKNSSDTGVARISVLERYGRGSKPANGYVEGFGAGFHGAIGSSVGHDSHNLVTVGSNTRDMRTAFTWLAEKGGGFCVVRDGAVLAELPLPLGGLMSAKSPGELRQGLEALQHASRSIGCALREPFLQLAFLCLPVIPELKITDQGLVDVREFRVIDVRA